MRDRESQSSKYYGIMSPRAIDLYNKEEVYFISYLDCRNLFLQMLTILVNDTPAESFGENYYLDPTPYYSPYESRN